MARNYCQLFFLINSLLLSLSFCNFSILINKCNKKEAPNKIMEKECFDICFSFVTNKLL